MALSDLQNIDIGDIRSWPAWFKVTGIILVSVAILGLGYWFVVKDEIGKLERAQSAEIKLRNTFLDKKALAVNLPAYRKQMNEMEESFGVLLRQLPDKTEVPALLVEITQAGLSRGLEFSTFKPKTKRNADFYAVAPIDLKVTGSFHEIGEFVSDLAALPRIVTLGNLRIAPISKGGGDLLIMTAETRTYHYLDEDEQAVEHSKKSKKSRNKRS